MADPTKTQGTPNQSKTAIWNDPTFRSIAFQVLAVLIIGWFFYFIFDNTLTNRAKSGVTTGFAFLNSTSGFGILMTLIDYDETHTYLDTFFVGLLNTLLVSALGIAAATVVGFVMGIARLSQNWLIAKIATVYVETLRNIPLLLQIFFWYSLLRTLPGPKQSYVPWDNVYLNARGFYLPGPIPESGFGLVMAAFVIAVIASVVIVRWAHKRQDQTGQPFPSILTSIGLIVGLPLLAFVGAGMPLSFENPVLKAFNYQGGLRIIPELTALWWALSLYTAAFIAEIVRAGILAVSHGQTEAAHALGVRTGPTLRLVIIPQAMRVIIPPLTSQYLNLAKNSSLATAIGYPDLVGVFMGTTLNQSGQAVEIVAMTMSVYLVMSLSISAFMNWFNAKMSLVER